MIAEKIHLVKSYDHDKILCNSKYKIKDDRSNIRLIESVKEVNCVNCLVATKWAYKGIVSQLEMVKQCNEVKKNG